MNDFMILKEILLTLFLKRTKYASSSETSFGTSILNDEGVLMNQSIEKTIEFSKKTKFSPEEKVRIVKEAFSKERNVSMTAKKHGLYNNQIYKWKKDLAIPKESIYLRSSADMFPMSYKPSAGTILRTDSDSKIKQLEERIKRLEKILLQKVEEIDSLTDAVEFFKNCNA